MEEHGAMHHTLRTEHWICSLNADDSAHMFQEPKRSVTHVPAAQRRTQTAPALLAMRAHFTCYRERRGWCCTRYRGVSREGAVAVAQVQIGGADEAANRRAQHAAAASPAGRPALFTANVRKVVQAPVNGEAVSGDLHSARTIEPR